MSDHYADRAAEEFRDQIREILPDNLANSPLPDFLAGGLQLLFGGAPTVAMAVVFSSIAIGIFKAFGGGKDFVTETDITNWRQGIRGSTGWLSSDYFDGRVGYRYPDTAGRRTDANVWPFVTPARNRTTQTLITEPPLRRMVDAWTSQLLPATGREQAKVALFFEALTSLHVAYGERLFLDEVSHQVEWVKLRAALGALPEMLASGDISAAKYNGIVKRMRELVILPPDTRHDRLVHVAPELQLAMVSDVKPAKLCTVFVQEPDPSIPSVAIKVATGEPDCHVIKIPWDAGTDDDGVAPTPTLHPFWAGMQRVIDLGVTVTEENRARIHMAFALALGREPTSVESASVDVALDHLVMPNDFNDSQREQVRVLAAKKDKRIRTADLVGGGVAAVVIVGTVLGLVGKGSTR